MGGRDPEMILLRRERAVRARRMTAITAVMTSILLLLAIQFFLLMVALESFQSGRGSILLPSALGSGLCFAACGGLIRYITIPKAGER